MTAEQQPPRRVKVLTRLRINEVSAVDHGAGEGVKIMLMKRDADDTPVELSVEERAKAKMAGRQALRDAEERYKREDGTGHADHEPAEDEPEIRPTPADDPKRFLFSKATFMRKTFAADARGDEATRADEATSAEELADDGVPAKHRSISFDTTDGHTITARDERALARWLAVHERLNKSTSTSQDTSTMDYKAKLTDLAKRAGPIAIAKVIVDDDNAYGITEHELTALVVECAKREHPQLTDAQAFVKLFTDQSEAGVMLRKAFSVVKAAGAAPYFDLKPQFVGGEDALDVDDPSEAIAQLKELGRQKWPTATEAQQFANAFADPANAKLAAKAHRRPSATTVYPFPK